jgi:regulator of sigma E protease
LIQNPGLLITILAFMLIIGPLVFVHELGHYFAGRLFGVKAEAFSIGFGRELVGVSDRRGTRWKLGWLPLGGYVRFAGDMNPASQPDAAWLALPPEERNRTFQAKPVWQRAIIVAAGPAVNFLVAIAILAGFAVAFGDIRNPPVVAALMPGSPAAQAGLQPGDRVTAIGGRGVDRFDDMARYVRLRAGETVRIDFLRSERRMSRAITVATDRQRDRFGNEFAFGRLGIAGGRPLLVPVAWWQAPGVGLRQTGEAVRAISDTLGQFITGRRSIKEMSGPIGTARVAGQQLSLGLVDFVWLAAFISINLGFINLLPVPMLDGGHLLFYALEAVRRRPIEARVQEWAFRGGLAALLALMIMVTVNDLGSVGLWKSLAGLIG